jgi:hypothetical protein
MKSNRLLAVGGALGLLAVIVLPQIQLAQAQEKKQDFVAPVIFQAAGPTRASIQSSVDEYRTALGETNNLNAQGPLEEGRREINWDGGNVNNVTTAVAGNPFAGFQATRGALFTTPDGTGFVQAPAASNVAPGGLAGLFNNQTYGAIFTAFSDSRLFSAIDGKITEVDFFVPGPTPDRATVSGFGAVFTDVDQPDGGGPGRRHQASTFIEYFDADGNLLFSSSVPASPGDGSLSFFGIIFPDARIARVRITSGNGVPGKDDDRKHDVVMMDDFIYGEPQPLQ